MPDDPGLQAFSDVTGSPAMARNAGAPVMMSSCAKPPSSLRSPARHATGPVKNGPLYANEWYSPFSPQGSMPVHAMSRTKSGSMRRPSQDGSSFAVSMQVTTARPPIATNSASSAAGAPPQSGSTCSRPAARVRSSYQARTSARWMSPNTTPPQPSCVSAVSAFRSDTSNDSQAVGTLTSGTPAAAA